MAGLKKYRNKEENSFDKYPPLKIDDPFTEEEVAEILNPGAQDINWNPDFSDEIDSELVGLKKYEDKILAAQEEEAAPIDSYIDEGQQAPAPMMTDPQVNAVLLEQLKALQGRVVPSPESHIMNNYVEEYAKAPRGIDFSGAAALFNNPQLMQAALATRPESAEQKRRNLAELQIKLAGIRAKELGAAAQGGRQQRFDEAQGLRKEDNIRKDVNKIADNYQTTQGQLDVAQQAVQRGDTRTVQMVITSIARNVGEQKGSLSDGDVQRSMPKDIATSVAGLQAWLGSPDAQISEPLQAALIDLIGRARDNSQKIYGESLDRRKKQYSAGNYAPLMKEGEVGDVIFNEAMGTAEQPAKAPMPQSSPTAKPPADKMRRLQELKNKAVGG